ncbi:MAG: antitoxin [Hoeflea sp.]|nr:antitoxin [Hoeflea sp.]MBC7281943.1 antitoxin [Hoeflea sp.]
MSRLTIDISPEQHKSLKAMAALEGKTIRQYALERLFPGRDVGGVSEVGGSRRPTALGDLIDKDEAAMDTAEKAAWASFGALLDELAAEALAGAVSDRSFDQIVEKGLESGRRNETA